MHSLTLAWRRGRLLSLRFQSRLLWHVLLAPTWLWRKSLRDPGAMKASAPPFTATTAATGGWSEPSVSDQSPHSLPSLHPQQPLWPCLACLGKGSFESHFQPGSWYSALESATKMKTSSQMGSPHYVQHHSQQEAAAKWEQTSGNVSEKLMEQGPLSHFCHTSPLHVGKALLEWIFISLRDTQNLCLQQHCHFHCRLEALFSEFPLQKGKRNHPGFF